MARYAAEHSIRCSLVAAVGTRNGDRGVLVFGNRAPRPAAPLLRRLVRAFEQLLA